MNLCNYESLLRTTQLNSFNFQAWGIPCSLPLIFIYASLKFSGNNDEEWNIIICGVLLAVIYILLTELLISRQRNLASICFVLIFTVYCCFDNVAESMILIHFLKQIFFKTSVENAIKYEVLCLICDTCSSFLNLFLTSTSWYVIFPQKIIIWAIIAFVILKGKPRATQEKKQPVTL